MAGSLNGIYTGSMVFFEIESHAVRLKAMCVPFGAGAAL
jgi:hypothetical protein